MNDPEGVIIKEKIAKGGQGIVYKGLFKGEEVAVKYQDIMRTQEKNSLKEIKNKNPQYLIPIKDISLLQDQRGNKLYEIVMELGSQNLNQYLESNKESECQKVEKFQIFYQAVAGVREFHSLGFIHRDIKPENFLISGYGKEQKLKLCDFGIAQRISAQKFTPNIGSIYYMAPEIIKGNYDKRVDIWSLGMILYEMLTRKTFFYGTTIQQISNKIIQCSQEEINQIAGKEIVDEEERKLFLNLAQINPEKRIEIDELLNKLKSFIRYQKLEYKQVQTMKNQSTDFNLRNEIWIPDDGENNYSESNDSDLKNNSQYKIKEQKKIMMQDYQRKNLSRKLNKCQLHFIHKSFLQRLKQNKKQQQHKLQFQNNQQNQSSFKQQKGHFFQNFIKKKIKLSWLTDSETDKHTENQDVRQGQQKDKKLIFKKPKKFIKQTKKQEKISSHHESGANSQKIKKGKKLYAKKNIQNEDWIGKQRNDERRDYSAENSSSDSSDKPHRPKEKQSSRGYTQEQEKQQNNNGQRQSDTSKNESEWLQQQGKNQQNYNGERQQGKSKNESEQLQQQERLRRRDKRKNQIIKQNNLSYQ